MSPSPAPTVEFDQLFRYTLHARPPVSVAAESLLAFERITLRAPYAINRWIGGTSIIGVEVFVRRLEEGSWINDYVVRAVFPTPAKEAEFYEWLNGKMGLDKSKVKTLFALVAVGAVAAGVTYGVTKYATGPKAEQKAATVLAWNNTIIQIGAGELKMSPDEFVSAIKRAIPNKAANAKDVAKLLRPAKDGSAAGMMEIIGNSDLNIPPEVVDAMPTPEEIEIEPNDQEVPHPQVDVYIRASDLDSASRGWAALVPEVADRRVKLELGPGINPDTIYGKKKITGDVVAIMRPRKGKESIPVRYRLVKVNAD